MEAISTLTLFLLKTLGTLYSEQEFKPWKQIFEFQETICIWCMVMGISMIYVASVMNGMHVE